MAAGSDRRLAGPKQKHSLGMRLLNWYLDRVKVAARRDPEVAGAFFQVANLLAPPPTLMQPAIVLRVLRDGLRLGTRQDSTMREGVVSA